MTTYKGLIYPAKAFATTTATDPYLIALKDAFIQHWRYGHHPDLGRDTLFTRPEEIRSYCIRKVHVKTHQYSAKHSFNGTKDCWDAWQFGRFEKNGKPKKIPTSDAYLIYAVSSERHASILTFWDPPAHSKAEEMANIGLIIDSAADFYRKRGYVSMERTEELWSYRWRK